MDAEPATRAAAASVARRAHLRLRWWSPQRSRMVQLDAKRLDSGRDFGGAIIGEARLVLVVPHVLRRLQGCQSFVMGANHTSGDA